MYRRNISDNKSISVNVKFYLSFDPFHNRTHNILRHRTYKGSVNVIYASIYKFEK